MTESGTRDEQRRVSRTGPLSPSGDFLPAARDQQHQVGGVAEDARQAIRSILSYFSRLLQGARDALTNLYAVPIAPGAQVPDEAGKLPETPVFKDKSAGRVPYVAARIRKAFPSAPGSGVPSTRGRSRCCSPWPGSRAASRTTARTRTGRAGRGGRGT
jgi:hypothetical protein